MWFDRKAICECVVMQIDVLGSDSDDREGMILNRVMLWL